MAHRKKRRQMSSAFAPSLPLACAVFLACAPRLTRAAPLLLPSRVGTTRRVTVFRTRERKRIEGFFFHFRRFRNNSSPSFFSTSFLGSSFSPFPPPPQPKKKKKKKTEPPPPATARRHPLLRRLPHRGDPGRRLGRQARRLPRRDLWEKRQWQLELWNRRRQRRRLGPARRGGRLARRAVRRGLLGARRRRVRDGRDQRRARRLRREGEQEEEED